MNLRQLYYFKELAEQKQFLKAAKSLNISQPSLSNSLKSLEKELGCQLINRSSSQIFLTEYGQIFYKTVVSSVSSLEDAKNKIQQLKLAEQNIVSIGSIPTALNKFLIPTIQDFQNKTQSNIKFHFQAASTKEICDGIRSGKFDFGISNKDIKYTDLTFIPLYSEPLVIITRDKLLTQKNSSLDNLENYTVITYESQSLIGKKVINYLHKNYRNINIKDIGTDNLSIASDVVANKETAIIVNDPVIDKFNLQKISLNSSEIDNTIYLIINKNKDYKENIYQLINYINKQKRA